MLTIISMLLVSVLTTVADHQTSDLAGWWAAGDLGRQQVHHYLDAPSHNKKGINADKLRWMFRYIKLPETSGANIVLEDLENGPLFRDLPTSWSQIEDLIVQDPELSHKMMEVLLTKHSTLSQMNTLAVEKSYEECRKDYDELVQPVINGLARRILRVLPACDIVCRYCDFCNLPGPQTCPPSLPCTNCSNDCPAVAEDLLLELFPDSPKYLWRAQMLDAMGKIPSGLSDGNLNWVGAYKMCLDTEARYNYTDDSTGTPQTEERSFTGQYCRIPLDPPVAMFTESVLAIYFGGCVPDSCTPESITTYITNVNGTGNAFLGVFLGGLNITVDTERIFCGFEIVASESPALVGCACMILVIVIFGVFVTVYDVFLRPARMRKLYESIAPDDAVSNYSNNLDSNHYATIRYLKTPDGYKEVSPQERRQYSTSSSDSTPESIRKPPLESSSSSQLNLQAVTLWDRLEVLCVGFSSYSNTWRIWTIRKYDGYLDVLDGVRFLTYCWALLGNVWLFGPVLAEAWTTANLRRALTTIPRNWHFQAIINYHFSSDTFLLISGILLSYHWLRRYTKDNPPTIWSVLRLYLHKWWRLVPAMILVIFFYASTYKFFTAGPIAPYLILDAEYCQNNWWVNMLLVHNLVKTDELCLTWTFQLALLWQLILVSPLVLGFLIKWPYVSYGMLILMYLVNIACLIGLASTNFGVPEDFFSEQFLTPWCRAGPFIIGMALGIILYKIKCKVKIPTWLSAIGWCVSLVCITSVVYGTYGIFKEGGALWDQPTQVIYETLCRTTWSLGVSWIIFVCATGNGGFVGSILNWPAFQPLSKMVFSTWLLHALIVFTLVYGKEYVLYVSVTEITWLFFANVIATIISGFMFVALCFHYPISIGIERMFLVRTKLDCIKAGNYDSTMFVNDSDKSVGDNVRRNQVDQITHKPSSFEVAEEHNGIVLTGSTTYM